ncbi:hypothetical protein DNTS_025163, partial [Danionella cerebrum]
SNAATSLLQSHVNPSEGIYLVLSVTKMKCKGASPQSESTKNKKLKASLEDITSADAIDPKMKNNKKLSKKRKVNEQEFQPDLITSQENTFGEKTGGKKRKKNKVEEFQTDLPHENGKNADVGDEKTEKKTKRRKKNKPEELQEGVMTSQENNTADENGEKNKPEDDEKKKRKLEKKNKRQELVEDLSTSQEKAADETTETKTKKSKKTKSEEFGSDQLKSQDSDTTVGNSNEDTKKKLKKRKKNKPEIHEDLTQEQQKSPVVMDKADCDEDLTPEEIRVLERKMKKIQKKRQKMELKERGNCVEPETSEKSVAETKALEYLRCWSENREEWRFQKTRQTWLLQNMFDSVKVSDSDFKVLLSYLEGLKGAAQAETLKKAEAIMRLDGEEEEQDQKRQHRAKEVAMLL